MLEERDTWAKEAATAAAFDSSFAGCDDRRRSERHPFIGSEVFLFVYDDQRYRMRVRDLCTSGISGLTDAPVGIGESLIVQLEEMLMPAARLVWTRCALVGFTFLNPLPLGRLNRLRERHASGAAWSPAMRAGSDLHGWWTDAAAHSGGRKARLDAGGHDHPLPR